MLDLGLQPPAFLLRVLLGGDVEVGAAGADRRAVGFALDDLAPRQDPDPAAVAVPQAELLGELLDVVVEAGGNQIQGIGDGFVPAVLDVSLRRLAAWQGRVDAPVGVVARPFVIDWRPEPSL